MGLWFVLRTARNDQVTLLGPRWTTVAHDAEDRLIASAQLRLIFHGRFNPFCSLEFLA